jgi:hypothetical protein
MDKVVFWKLAKYAAREINQIASSWPSCHMTVKNPLTEIKREDRREIKQNTIATRHIKSVPHFLIRSSCVNVFSPQAEISLWAIKI